MPTLNEFLEKALKDQPINESDPVLAHRKKLLSDVVKSLGKLESAYRNFDKSIDAALRAKEVHSISSVEDELIKVQNTNMRIKDQLYQSGETLRYMVKAIK